MTEDIHKLFDVHELPIGRVHPDENNPRDELTEKAQEEAARLLAADELRAALDSEHESRIRYLIEHMGACKETLKLAQHEYALVEALKPSKKKKEAKS